MKKYLWAVMAVLFMSANASGFRDIDISTHSFLSDLRAAAGSDDEFADEEEDEIDAPEAAVEESVGEEEVVVEEANVSEEGKTEAAAQQAMDEAKKKEEAEKLEEAQKEKEALLAEIAAKEEALKKAKAQAEQEKREVEAYEKKRAEKIAKEAQEKAELNNIVAKAKAAEKALAEKEAAAKKAETVAKSTEIDPDAEKKAAKDAADTKYWEAVQEIRKSESEIIAVEKISTEKETPEKKSEIADIDLDAEKIAAKEAADKKYLEAIQEMRKGGSERLVVETRTVEKVSAKKAEITDIDLDAEKKAAKEAADKAYLEAVHEMNEAE